MCVAPLQHDRKHQPSLVWKWRAKWDDDGGKMRVVRIKIRKDGGC